MTEKEIIDMLLTEANKHNDSDIECCIAGYRKDKHLDYYTYGEIKEALNTKTGYVWESHIKSIIDTIMRHPEIFH